MVEDTDKRIVEKALIAARCPNCSGILSSESSGRLECPFCNTQFFLHESYRGDSDKVSNFYELAYSAQTGNNPGEAYKYFTKVLENDTKEALAWFGKGVAAFGMSTGFNIRIDEAIGCFAKADQYADDKEVIKKSIGSVLGFYIRLFSRYFTRLNKSGGLESSHVSMFIDLVEANRQISEVDTDSLKAAVDFLCLVNEGDKHSDRIQEYTGIIREKEPRYLNYTERLMKAGQQRRLTTVLVIITIIVAIVLCIVISKYGGDSNDKNTINDQTDVYDKQGEVAVGWGLPIRKTPDSKGELIEGRGALKQGETVEIIELTEDDWAKIRTEDGFEGYSKVELRGDELIRINEE